MTGRTASCKYCGLRFSGAGYSPNGTDCYCCCGCYLVERILGSSGEEGIAAGIILRLGLGAFLSMNVMCISLVLYLDGAGGPSAVRVMHWLLLILSTPALLILGAPFVMGAVRDLRSMRLSTDALIATGSLAAYGVSAAHVVLGSGHVYFDTATMLLTIVTIGRLVEATAKSRTSGSIREMMSLMPSTAHVLGDGEEREVPVGELRAGDTVLVKPGERIPADGTILSGECLVEESAFTGESRPRSCAFGDRVFGGSVNRDGLITVEAAAVGSDSLLAQVQRMVERARDERAPVERLAERISSVFVPAIWLTALAAGLYWGLVRGDIERAGLSALAVLVVACPCALGLATPIATCLAIGRAARSGVLIRSGEILEQLPRLTSVFFDKTGTLTDGNLEVEHVLPPDSNEPLAWAASLESASEHAVARAIVRAARDRGLTLGEVTDFRAIPGRGAEGTVTLNGVTRRVVVGSTGLPLPLGEGWGEGSLPFGPRTSDLGHRERGWGEGGTYGDCTAASVLWNGTTQATFLLRDAVRPGAREVIERLSGMGIRSAIISGDREGPVRRVASELGIEDVLHGCLPEEKVEAVRKARSSGVVAVVGDGINDAPALAEADVGIAVGGGTDLAREASDVTLLGDDLSRIPFAIDLARSAYRAIRNNLLWAFGYNSVAVALAFFGLVHPLIAATAMLGSSLTVIGNSMRVAR